MYKYTKLMYPEPDAVGGNGGSEEPIADTTEVKTEEESNPFDSLSFDETEDNQQEQDDTETQTDSEDFALTFDESLNLDDTEKTFFTEAAKECGLSSEVASRVFSELVRKVNENNEKVFKERENNALNELRKSWGKSFNANSKQAAQLIKMVGAKRGWSVDKMNSFKNANDMALFYDIASAISGRLSLGVGSSAPAKAPLTKEQLASDLNSTITAYWNAQERNDVSEMRRLSDKHMEILEAQTGKKGIRLLAIP